MNVRRTLATLLAAAVLAPLTACNAQSKSEGLFMKKSVVLDLVMYSYWDRPISDVYLNRVDIGLANSYGGSGIITSVVIPLGPQTLTWRLGGPRGTPRNGETVGIKNSLVLNADQIPANARYIGVHIYPDSTAEFTFSKYMPDTTPRGDELIAKGRAGRGE